MYNSSRLKLSGMKLWQFKTHTPCWKCWFLFQEAARKCWMHVSLQFDVLTPLIGRKIDFCCLRHQLGRHHIFVRRRNLAGLLLKEKLAFCSNFFPRCETWAKCVGFGEQLAVREAAQNHQSGKRIKRVQHVLKLHRNIILANWEWYYNTIHTCAVSCQSQVLTGTSAQNLVLSKVLALPEGFCHCEFGFEAECPQLAWTAWSWLRKERAALTQRNKPFLRIRHKSVLCFLFHCQLENCLICCRDKGVQHWTQILDFMMICTNVSPDTDWCVS